MLIKKKQEKYIVHQGDLSNAIKVSKYDIIKYAF